MGYATMSFITLPFLLELSNKPHPVTTIAFEHFFDFYCKHFIISKQLWPLVKRPSTIHPPCAQ